MQTLEEKKKQGSILVQVRMPAELVAQIESLVKRGLFQGRTDFILESTRVLLSRYVPEDPIRRAMESSVSKAPKRGYRRILTQQERLKIMDAFKGRDPLELSRWARERV